MATLALFAVACRALTAASPGPDMLLIASRSISQGNRQARWLAVRLVFDGRR